MTGLPKCGGQDGPFDARAEPFTATVQALLGHLRSQGIDFVPEPLGYDDEGREVLSFVEGDVPTDPLPDTVWGEEVLVALAGLIRRLHDAAEGWRPPTDATWGSIPGQQHVTVPALFTRPELVAHQDYCPGNVVFRSGLPAAVIDSSTSTSPVPPPGWLTVSTPGTGGCRWSTPPTDDPQPGTSTPAADCGSSPTPTACPPPSGPRWCRSPGSGRATAE